MRSSFRTALTRLARNLKPIGGLQELHFAQSVPHDWRLHRLGQTEPRGRRPAAS